MKTKAFAYASIIEVIGGQPFDAWKISLQTNNGLKIKNLWRASSISCIHRVCFYMPSIYITNGYITKIYQKMLITPLIVTAHVSFFENIKTQRQLKHNKLQYLPKTLLSTYLRESCFITGLTIGVPLLEQQGYSNTISCILAGAIAQCLSQPFDTIKTIQEQKQIGFKSAYKTKTLPQLWIGLPPRLLRGIWTFYCMNYISKHINDQWL